MRGGFLMLRTFGKVLVKILFITPRCSNSVMTTAAAAYSYDLNDLPEDVKKGHFLVHPCDDGELSSFTIQLECLAHRGFLKLLKQVEEEFGFKQAGVLAVPCGSKELQRILENLKDWM